METAWVVYGEKGSYSDYSMWVVGVFDDESEARSCADRLNRPNQALYEEAERQRLRQRAYGYKRDRSTWPEYTAEELPRNASVVEEYEEAR